MLLGNNLYGSDPSCESKSVIVQWYRSPLLSVLSGTEAVVLDRSSLLDMMKKETMLEIRSLLIFHIALPT